MKHFEFSAQFRQPKGSKRTSHIKTAIIAALAVAFFFAWITIFAMMFEVWAHHPAEQPINGQAYMMAIQNGGDNKKW